MCEKSSRPEMFCQKGVLEISQNSQENSCARVSLLIKLQASGLQLYQKGHSGTGVFITLFLTKHLWWLLLVPVNHLLEK